MNFLKDNIKWIAFIIIILLLSNLLTGISVNSLSKKDRQRIKRKYDSLETKYKQLDFIHIEQLQYRRKIFLEDSVLQLQYKKKQEEDANLIKLQKEVLNKYKKNSSKVNISKLDSAYEAEN